MQSTTQQPLRPPQPGQQQGLGTFIGPIIAVVILVVCVFILNGKPKTEIPDGMPNARFSTKDEIRAGNREARRQIAKGELTETAFELNPETGITFAFSNPGGVFPGLSGTGKSKNFIIPTLRSAIRQKHSIFVTDVEGELIKATAAYAHANGYKGRIYAYAPGVQSLSPLGKLVQFGGSFSFLDVMRHPNDKAKAQEISRGLNVNTQEDTQKRHGLFWPTV